MKLLKWVIPPEFKKRTNAKEEIKNLREILRYIWSHGDENGKVPYSWGQKYAERFIKLAKQEWERKND